MKEFNYLMVLLMVIGTAFFAFAAIGFWTVVTSIF